MHTIVLIGTASLLVIQSVAKNGQCKPSFQHLSSIAQQRQSLAGHRRGTIPDFDAWPPISRRITVAAAVGKDKIHQVPRGGLIRIFDNTTPQDNLMLLYVFLHAVVAIPGTMAPEVASQVLTDVKLVDGGLEHMMAELMFATMGGLVLMIVWIQYHHRNVRVTTAIAAGGLVFTYPMVKHALKESYDRFKFRRGGGVVQSAVLIILITSMLWRIPLLNSELAATLFCALSMVPSTIGLVSSTVGFMWYGLPKNKMSSGIVFAAVFRWYHVFQFIFGATGLLLLNGKSIQTATGIASILGALAIAEQIFGGYLGSAKTKELSMVGLTVLALISVGLFLA